MLGTITGWTASLGRRGVQAASSLWGWGAKPVPAEAIADRCKWFLLKDFKKQARGRFIIVLGRGRRGLVLGQVKVADKSNEIVAIPKLLDMLAIEGAVVTIDAMGCQRAIAQKIMDKKADYILALKGNQGALREDVELFVAEQKAKDFKDTTVSRAETVDGDHGRIETREVTVIHDVEWLQEQHAWPGLKSVVMVESTREIDGKTERETRFYITSLVLLANQIGPSMRDHWADREQPALGLGHGLPRRRMPRAHRSRAGQLRHPQAHGLQPHAKGHHQDSMRLRRKVAAWDDEFLASLVAA